MGIKTITFTNTNNFVSEKFKPIPASKHLPEWYKNHASFLGGKKEVPTVESRHGTLATVKKCMPVFDAITQGYLLLTSCDIYIKPDEDNLPYYSWPHNDYEVIAFHPKEQAENHPQNTNEPFPKWLNPWGIKTPKGYSVFITSPIHRNNVFNVLEGVVDTDAYTNPINILFKLKTKHFEGLIPAGTPIAQVVPFKREEWQMQFGGSIELAEIQEGQNLTKSLFYDKYKTFFRQKKEYK